MQHALIFTNSVLGMGIRSTLEQTPNWSVSHASTQIPEEMVNLALQKGVAVTILDTTSLKVLDLFQQLGKDQVELFRKIVVISLSGLDEEELFFLMKWDVSAHISGSTAPGELTSILQRVTDGEYLLSSDCLRQRRVTPSRLTRSIVIEELSVLIREESHVAAETTPLPSPLTEREAAILCGFAQGMASKQVAHTLGLAEISIKNSVILIFEKLQVDNRTSAVVCALRRKWIPMPEIPRTQVAEATVA